MGTFHMRGGDDTVVLWSGVPLAGYPTLVVTRHDADGAAAGEEVLAGEEVMVGDVPADVETDQT